MNKNYSIVIQWSEKDNCYVATLPEWQQCHALGKSYEEALTNARQAIDILVRTSLADGRILPEARTFQDPSVL